MPFFAIFSGKVVHEKTHRTKSPDDEGESSE